MVIIDGFSIKIIKALNGREGGIRTHVGLHPNGFQDRPVVTASVPLDIQMQDLFYQVVTVKSRSFEKIY